MAYSLIGVRGNDDDYKLNLFRPCDEKTKPVHRIKTGVIEAKPSEENQ